MCDIITISNSYVFTLHDLKQKQSGEMIFDLFYSILGCVLSLQEIAVHQSSSTFSALCYPCLCRSLLHHNVISPGTCWTTLHLAFCASDGLSIVFHVGYVSNQFPFRIGLVSNYVFDSGSLGDTKVDTNSVAQFALR